MSMGGFTSLLIAHCSLLIAVYCTGQPQSQDGLKIELELILASEDMPWHVPTYQRFS
jgi:hypothetical protein